MSTSGTSMITLIFKKDVKGIFIYNLVTGFVLLYNCGHLQVASYI